MNEWPFRSSVPLFSNLIKYLLMEILGVFLQHVWNLIPLCGTNFLCRERRDNDVSSYLIICQKIRVVFSSFTSTKIALLPPATKLGQGYIFTRICDSVNKGGICLSACWDTPLQEQTPPGSRPPPRSRHPPEQTPPTRQEQTPPGTRQPPGAEHAGRYGQRANGTHPTGMQSCYYWFPVVWFRLTSIWFLAQQSVSWDLIWHV